MYMNREFILKALRNNFKGQIARHVANALILIDNPVGVAEHPDTIETIENELNKIAEYHDKLKMIKLYLENN
jgi:hypothetical protein